MEEPSLKVPKVGKGRPTNWTQTESFSKSLNYWKRMTMNNYQSQLYVQK